MLKGDPGQSSQFIVILKSNWEKRGRKGRGKQWEEGRGWGEKGKREREETQQDLPPASLSISLISNSFF